MKMYRRCLDKKRGVYLYASITLKVTEDVKKRLEKKKIIPRETINDVIVRLLDLSDQQEKK